MIAAISPREGLKYVDPAAPSVTTGAKRPVNTVKTPRIMVAAPNTSRSEPQKSEVDPIEKADAAGVSSNTLFGIKKER